MEVWRALCYCYQPGRLGRRIPRLILSASSQAAGILSHQWRKWRLVENYHLALDLMLERPGPAPGTVMVFFCFGSN